MPDCNNVWSNHKTKVLDKFFTGTALHEMYKVLRLSPRKEQPAKAQFFFKTQQSGVTAGCFLNNFEFTIFWRSSTRQHQPFFKKLNKLLAEKQDGRARCGHFLR
jgi:hypothetical protein